MTTMVEKVARAIDPEAFRHEEIAKRFLGSAKRNWDGSMEKTVHEAKLAEVYLRARAAIEAMMDPTDAMILSQGKTKPENAATETQRERAEALNRSVRRLAVETWCEMIQAALKEGQ